MSNQNRKQIAAIEADTEKEIKSILSHTYDIDHLTDAQINEIASVFGIPAEWLKKDKE